MNLENSVPANRLRLAGVPRESAMRLVNHASALVHEICQREKVDDLMQRRDAVRFPTPALKTQSPEPIVA